MRTLFALGGFLVVFGLFALLAVICGLVASDLWGLFLTPVFGVAAPAWYVFVAMALIVSVIRPPQMDGAVNLSEEEAKKKLGMLYLNPLVAWLVGRGLHYLVS